LLQFPKCWVRMGQKAEYPACFNCSPHMQPPLTGKTPMYAICQQIAAILSFARPHLLIMYGPPPDCKRFEVERSDSLRKCIRPIRGESYSGHSMMIRAYRSL